MTGTDELRRAWRAWDSTDEEIREEARFESAQGNTKRARTLYFLQIMRSIYQATAGREDVSGLATIAEGVLRAKILEARLERELAGKPNDDSAMDAFHPLEIAELRGVALGVAVFALALSKFEDQIVQTEGHGAGNA